MKLIEISHYLLLFIGFVFLKPSSGATSCYQDVAFSCDKPKTIAPCKYPTPTPIDNPNIYISTAMPNPNPIGRSNVEVDYDNNINISSMSLRSRRSISKEKYPQDDFDFVDTDINKSPFGCMKYMMGDDGFTFRLCVPLNESTLVYGENCLFSKDTKSKIEELGLYPQVPLVICVCYTDNCNVGSTSEAMSFLILLLIVSLLMMQLNCF